MTQNIIDIAQVAFLEMIKEMIAVTGAPATKGALIRLSTKAGKQLTRMEFMTFEDFVASIGGNGNPISTTEGQATYLGEGLFGLVTCPFAGAIANYVRVFGALPDSYAGVTAEFNKPGPGTDPIRVGNGSAVSPFCSVHQPMRSTAASQILIGGHPLVVFQLGCKSAKGAKALSERWIAEGGWSAEAVSRTLDTHMCCYGVKVEGA